MSEPLQYDTVRFWDAGGGEMDGKRPVVFVARNDIARLELVYGSGAEHPLVAIVLGVVLIALATLPLFALIALSHGERVYGGIFMMFGFVVPGVWLIRLALRKRWLVLVHTRKGSTRKLVFQESENRSMMEALVADARRTFGYA